MTPEPIDLDAAITLTEEGINRFEDDILENPEVPIEEKVLCILTCSCARAFVRLNQLDKENA